VPPSNRFVFAAKAGVAGTVDGGTGFGALSSGAWLDYAAYTTAVAVDLAKGTATGVGGGVKNVPDVRGGSGGNALTGDDQGNVLVGGDGKDKLTGGSSRCILIGGKGDDTLVGGTGGAILIGGTTSYDASSPANDAALADLLAEWNSTDGYDARVAAIMKGVGASKAQLAPKVTVTDDLAANTLKGGSGLNWYFEGKKDKIKPKPAAGEVVSKTF
jgi:hypothetical protein